MLLNELFDTGGVKYNMNQVGNNLVYTFYIDGSWYNAQFDRVGNQSHFHFADDTNNNNDTGITGKGNAIKVFSTLKSIFLDAVNNHNVDNIMLGADSSEPSRVKLYDRFMKEFKNAGWNVVRKPLAKGAMISYKMMRGR